MSSDLEITASRIRLLSANERFAPMVINEDQVEWSLIVTKRRPQPHDPVYTTNGAQ